MLRKVVVLCAVVAMFVVMLTGSAFAESNIKKLEIKNSTTVKNALILAGRDAKIGSIELRNVTSDSIKIKNTTSVKNALVLAGRDAYIGNIMVD